MLGHLTGMDVNWIGVATVLKEGELVPKGNLAKIFVCF